MKTQNKRYPFGKIRFTFYVSVIMLFLFINCLNVAYAGERLAVAVPTANIRSGPGTKYRIVFAVEKGVAFKVLKRKGNWIQVQHADGDKGWIYKSLVW